MSETRKSLPMPEEPLALRAETRALLEENPEDGMKTINDARFVAEILWEEWGDGLEEAGMAYDAFLAIVRGYAGELRLWVVGERIWEHCAAGLAGRATRRLPNTGCEKELASAGASR